jgi:flagellar protein FlaJ
MRIRRKSNKNNKEKPPKAFSTIFIRILRTIINTILHPATIIIASLTLGAFISTNAKLLGLQYVTQILPFLQLPQNLQDAIIPLTLFIGILYYIATFYTLSEKAPQIKPKIFAMETISTTATLTASLIFIYTTAPQQFLPLLIIYSYLIISSVLAYAYIIAPTRKLFVAKKKFQPFTIPETAKPFVYVDFMSAVLFIPSILEGEYFIYIGYTTNDIIPLSFGAFLITYGIIGMTYFIYSILTPPTTIRLTSITGKWYIALTITRPTLYNRVRKLSDKLKPLIRKAGVFEDPNLLAAKAISTSLIIAFIAPPIATTFFIINPIYGIITATALLTGIILSYYINHILLSMKAGDRKRNTEKELPFFTVLASAGQSSNIYLPELLQTIDPKLFPQIGKEAQIVKKYTSILGYDPLQALEENAKNHPSKKWQDFIYGYTALMRSGGDLSIYLTSRLKEYLEFARFKMKQYAEHATTIGESLIGIFTLFTSVIAIAIIISPDTIMNMLILYDLLIVPLLIVTIYSIISSLQPYQPNKYTFTHTIPAIVTAIATIITILNTTDITLLITIPLIFLTLSYGIQFMLQAREITNLEKNLPEFLRELTEYRKIGTTLTKAIQEIDKKETTTYHKALKTWIRKAAALTRLGEPLEKAYQQTTSWFASIVIHMLGKIETMGGGTIETFENTTWFFTEFHIAKTEMKSSLRIYVILTLATPPLLIFIGAIVMAMTTAFASITATPVATTGAPIQMPIPTLSQQQIQQINQLLWITNVIVSIALTSLTGKITDFSIKNTFYFSIALILLLISSLIMPQFAISLIPSAP